MIRIAIVLSLAMAAPTAPALADSGAPHPIVFSDTGILLGGSRGGEWLTAAEVAAALSGKELYSHYSLRHRLGSGDGGPPESFGDPCPDSRFVEMLVPDRGSVVSLAADWNALPRAPREQSPEQKVYRDSAAAFLLENGIETNAAELAQVIRIDLEGDGVEEVLLSASHRAPRTDSDIGAGATPGDYSFILLRKLHEEKVETVMIAQDIHAAPTPYDIPYTFEIAAILDLNGDGVMEIVLSSGYYEGNAAAVITVDGLKVKQVLIEGCGA